MLRCQLHFSKCTTEGRHSNLSTGNVLQLGSGEEVLWIFSLPKFIKAYTYILDTFLCECYASMKLLLFFWKPLGEKKMIWETCTPGEKTSEHTGKCNKLQKLVLMWDSAMVKGQFFSLPHAFKGTHLEYFSFAWLGTESQKKMQEESEKWTRKPGSKETGKLDGNSSKGWPHDLYMGFVLCWEAGEFGHIVPSAKIW